MKTFWDFCAPFYDLAEKANGPAYAEMLATVNRIIPQGATVLEMAAGTGAISIAVANKASRVLCTDISEKMLNVARKKITKRSIKNIAVENQSIYEIPAQDNSFDIVIAGQVLHLIDEPKRAVAELRRVAKSMVIMPMSLTKNLRGTAKLGIDFYRVFGFSPKVEFTASDYKNFLPTVGFENCELIDIGGKIPMAIAVWKK